MGIDLADYRTDVEDRLTLMSPPGSDEAGRQLLACMARLDHQLAAYRTRQTQLIGVVRMINAGMGRSSTSPDGSGLPAACLGAPPRVTKRDYNYFDELQDALRALSARQRSNGGAQDLGAG